MGLRGPTSKGTAGEGEGRERRKGGKGGREEREMEEGVRPLSQEEKQNLARMEAGQRR